MAREIREEEKKKYQTHGFMKMIIGVGDYFIELDSLNPQPTRAWLNRSPKGIELLVASDKMKNYNGRSVEFERARKLGGVYIDPKEPTNKGAIKPAYKENGTLASS